MDFVGLDARVEARSFHVANVTDKTLRPLVKARRMLAKHRASLAAREATMGDPVSLGIGAVGATANAFNLVKSFVEVRDAVKVQELKFELLCLLLEAQQAQASLVAEKQQLAERVRELEACPPCAGEGWLSRRAACLGASNMTRQ